MIERRSSTKGCSEQFHTRVEKLDLKLALYDRRALANQLIQPLLPRDTVAIRIDIATVISTG